MGQRVNYFNVRSTTFSEPFPTFVSLILFNLLLLLFKMIKKYRWSKIFLLGKRTEEKGYQNIDVGNRYTNIEAHLYEQSQFSASISFEVLLSLDFSSTLALIPFL